jgi:hypothetical protein
VLLCAVKSRGLLARAGAVLRSGRLGARGHAAGSTQQEPGHGQRRSAGEGAGRGLGTFLGVEQRAGERKEKEREMGEGEGRSLAAATGSRGRRLPGGAVGWGVLGLMGRLGLV